MTQAEYLATEQRYVTCITALLRRSGVDALRISCCENGGDVWIDDQSVSGEALTALLQDCLRGNCWCVLTAPDAYVHFGYDYYVYVGCPLTPDTVDAICREHGLFSNPQPSPYAAGASPRPTNLLSLPIDHNGVQVTVEE